MHSVTIKVQARSKWKSVEKNQLESRIMVSQLLFLQNCSRGSFSLALLSLISAAAAAVVSDCCVSSSAADDVGYIPSERNTSRTFSLEEDV